MVLLDTSMLLIATQRRLLLLVALADVSNVLIIAFFFNREMVVSALHSIGVLYAEHASPFDVGSVILLFANTRNMFHEEEGWVLLINLYLNLYSIIESPLVFSVPC